MCTRLKDRYKETRIEKQAACDLDSAGQARNNCQYRRSCRTLPKLKPQSLPPEERLIRDHDYYCSISVTLAILVVLAITFIG
jgi:hypothetical protein